MWVSRIALSKKFENGINCQVGSGPTGGQPLLRPFDRLVDAVIQNGVENQVLQVARADVVDLKALLVLGVAGRHHAVDCIIVAAGLA